MIGTENEPNAQTEAADQNLTGLTAAQVKALTVRGQVNKMPHSGDGGVFTIVRRNVFTLFNLLNTVLAALLVLVGSYRNLLFMGVVVSNSIIGLVQELRAKKMHDQLLLLSEGRVRALRDGAETMIPPGELVQGDVIRLRRGDQIPADATVLLGAAEVNESLLTGESEPIPKKVSDTLLSGSYLTEGELTAKLTEVGAQSFAGKLQLAARRMRRPRSELMASLNRVIRVVSVLIIPIGVALYLRQTIGLGMDTPTAVTKTVAATLGMIPEGLILLTSVALAVGVVRLGRRGALVNELYGIENLARVDTLCLDKTGTLTSGQMSVTDVLLIGDTAHADVVAAMGAFTAAFAGEDNPTSHALAIAFHPKANVHPTATVPFSSERKWSAAEIPGLGTLVLGAPEKTLNSHPEALTLAHTHAAKGLRVLALLRSEQSINGKQLPEGLAPMALILVDDALRPEVCNTLRYFDAQGVTVKVISGDSALTVARIATLAGLSGAEHSVDCSALVKPVDYDMLAREYTVFGRVSPEDKRALVGALKRQGHTVGMIGDGVNDVPALKAADCSIAMAGGSDAASRVAQITLLNAEFSVMPDIVLEGRRVINNITRASALFLVKNLFSFLLASLLLVLPFAYPFAPIQLTLVSSLTIGLPSFVLALQPNRERVSGHFLTNVLRRAIPGGLTVFMVCAGVLVAGRLLGLTEQEVSTLCTLLAAFSGLCVLVLACLPMDRVRVALSAGMAWAVLLSVLLFPNVFYLTPVAGNAVWVLAIAAVAVIALLAGLTALVTHVKPNATPPNGASR